MQCSFGLTSQLCQTLVCQCCCLNSSVAAQPAVARPARPPTLLTAAVTALYVDKFEKKQRANNVIVTGLQSSQVILTVKCSTEFNILPDILFNKRLDRIMPGKIQALLVFMRDLNQTQQLIAKARLLRISANQDIKYNVSSSMPI